jgi:hypothetical protein
MIKFSSYSCSKLKYTNQINHNVIREMTNTSPNRKAEKEGKIECLFSNLI